MNEIIKLIEEGRVYSYLNYDMGVSGIVIADNEEEARQKVIESYEKHGYKDTDFRYLLDIIKLEQTPFSDSMEVLETSYWE